MSKLTLALLLAVVAGACDIVPLSVEGEIPDVEVTQENIRIEGGQELNLLGDVSISEEYEQELPSLDLPPELFSQVRVWDVTLAAKSGASDLSFIKTLMLTMAPSADSPSGEPTVLVVYERPENDTVGDVLKMPLEVPVDVAALWTGEKVKFTLDMTGTLPAQSWTADVTVHFSGKVKYEY